MDAGIDQDDATEPGGLCQSGLDHEGPGKGRPDEHRRGQCQCAEEFQDVPGDGGDGVSRGGPCGASAATPVNRDHPVVLDQIRQLAAPDPAAGAPPVQEDHRLARALVFIEQLDPVYGQICHGLLLDSRRASSAPSACGGRSGANIGQPTDIDASSKRR